MAQKNTGGRTDSLLAALANAKEDTGKVNLLADISFSFAQTNPALTIDYAEQSLRLAQALQWKPGIANAWARLAAGYIGQSRLDEALGYAEKSLRLFEELHDKTAMAACIQYLTTIYTDKGDYGKALEYSNSSFALLAQTGNKKMMAASLNRSGTLYEKLNNYPAALKEYLGALKIYEDLGNQNGKAALLSNIGRIYFYTSEQKNVGQLQLALDYVMRAVSINETTGNKTYLGINYIQLGRIFNARGDYEKAIKYQLLALKIFTEMGNKAAAFSALSYLGAYNKELKQYPVAARYLDEAGAISRELKNAPQAIQNKNDLGSLYARIGKDSAFVFDAADTLIPGSRLAVRQKAAALYREAAAAAREGHTLLQHRDVLEGLAGIEEQLGNYSAALNAYAEYVAYKDSAFNTDKTKEIARYELKYEYGKREDSLRFRQELTDQQLREQRLLATQRSQALHIKEQQLQLAGRERDLQRLAYLKAQADLQAEHAISQETAKALTIGEKERLLQTMTLKLQESRLLLKERELHTRSMQRNVMLAGGALLLLFGGISFYRFRKQKLLENRQALLNERLRISRDLHDDMGATLSSISVYSSAVKQRLSDAKINEAQTMLDTISADARDMVDNMSDMVWMINPKNDTVEKLFDRMQLFAANVLAAKGILFHFRIDAAFDAMPLGMEARKNVFLIFKEAVNNAAKYAGCKVVEVSLLKDAAAICMTISDDGAGFDATRAFEGNGLRNMRERAAGLQAGLELRSAPGKGTTLSLRYVISPQLVRR